MFLFDNFFTPDDANGIDIEVPIGNQNIPFTVKRSVSVKDMFAAKASATKMRFKPTGEPEVYAFDEGTMNIEILARTLKAWPFLYSDGKPVPLTRENIQILDGDVIEPIVKAINEIIQKRRTSSDPFVNQSGAAS